MKTACFIENGAPCFSVVMKQKSRLKKRRRINEFNKIRESFNYFTFNIHLFQFYENYEVNFLGHSMTLVIWDGLTTFFLFIPLSMEVLIT